VNQIKIKSLFIEEKRKTFINTFGANKQHSRSLCEKFYLMMDAITSLGENEFFGVDRMRKFASNNESGSLFQQNKTQMQTQNQTQIESQTQTNLKFRHYNPTFHLSKTSEHIRHQSIVKDQNPLKKLNPNQSSKPKSKSPSPQSQTLGHQHVNQNSNLNIVVHTNLENSSSSLTSNLSSNLSSNNEIILNLPMSLNNNNIVNSNPKDESQANHQNSLEENVITTLNPNPNLTITVIEDEQKDKNHG